MANQSSSKKIQRAARAAASNRDKRERRRLGFPAVLASVIILGIGMVVLSRNSRPAAEPPLRTDHWHSAYALYDCDRFLDPFTSAADPDGIHSHQDGVIHIHPWNSSATGQEARLKVFFDAMGVKVTEDEISGPEIGVLKAGSECQGQPTVIRAVRFRLPTDFDKTSILAAEDPQAVAITLEEGYQNIDEILNDFSEMRLLEDLEAFTIARVPADATILPPPGQRLISAFNSSAGGLLSSGPNSAAAQPIPDTDIPLFDAEPENGTDTTDITDTTGEAPATDTTDTTGEAPATDTTDTTETPLGDG